MFNWLKKQIVKVAVFVATGVAAIFGSIAQAADADISTETVGGHTGVEWVTGAITALGLVVGACLAFGFVMIILRKAKAAVKRT